MSTFMKSMKCASVLVAMSVGAVSCIDEAYDLSNGIDTTVTVEGNISAPIGSTAFMYVGDFLNLDEENSALVKNENGDYVLNVEGDGTHYEYRLPDVKVGDLFESGQQIRFTINAPYEGIDLEGHSLSEFELPEGGYLIPADVVPFPDEVRAFLSERKAIAIDIDEELPEEVSDVKKIGLDMDITLNFTTNFGPVHTTEHFLVDFPDYLVFAESPDYTMLEGNIMTDFAGMTLDASGQHSVTLKLVSIDFGKMAPGQGIENGRIVVSDNIFIGSESEEVYSFNPKEVQIYNSGYLPSSIEFTADVTASEPVIKEAEISISPDIAVDDQEFEISGIPETLTGNGTVLDIYNPQIELDIMNPSPFNLELSAELVAFKDDAELHRISIGGAENPISIEPGNGHLFISARGASVPDVLDGTFYKDIVIEDLTDLIKNVPDRIAVMNIRMTAPEDQYGTIIPNDTYNFTIGYGLSAPLAFGPEMRVETSIVTDGLQGGASDSPEDGNTGNPDMDGDGIPDEGQPAGDSGSGLEIDPSSNASVEISMIFSNAIPLDMTVTAVPIDIDGNEMTDGPQITVEGFVKGGSIQQPADSPIVLRTSAVADDIDRLDGVSLKLNVSAPQDASLQGIPLNEGQGIQLKDIKLYLNGKISTTL